jgi:hypothetical protein
MTSTVSVLGLNLAIIAQNIEQMGGRLGVDSKGWEKRSHFSFLILFPARQNGGGDLVMVNKGSRARADRRSIWPSPGQGAQTPPQLLLNGKKRLCRRELGGYQLSWKQCWNSRCRCTTREVDKHYNALYSIYTARGQPSHPSLNAFSRMIILSSIQRMGRKALV